MTPKDDAHSPPGNKSHGWEDNIQGFERAGRRKSLTTADGTVKINPIAGIICRTARTVSHANGYLTEVLRTDWGFPEMPIVQVTATTTLPRRVRAWGLHQHTFDRLFVGYGSLCVVCYDARRDSATFGQTNEFVAGTHNPALIGIPPGIYHGWINLGPDEATIISMPSILYEHDNPDRWEIPWNSDAARETIGYRWPSFAE